MRPPLPVLATIALGLAALAASCAQVAQQPTATAALFVAAAIGVELLRRSGDELTADPIEEQSFNVATPIQLAAVVVGGPWVGAVVGSAAVLAVRRLHGAEWSRIAFRAAVLALSGIGAGFAFDAAGGHVGGVALPGDLVPLAALGAGYWGPKMLALTLASPWAPARFELVTAAGEGGLAIVIALFASAEPWNLLAAAPVLLLLDGVHARLVTLRRDVAGALETFANIVDERDPSTHRHSMRVAEYVRELAEAVGLPASDVERLRWAGRLHDLGKVAVDAAVLRKPDRLADDEWAAVHRAPRLSARLLQRFRFAAQQAQAVEFQHERYDGCGYYGVEAHDVPLASHFLIVADSFDAMTSARPFREPLSRQEALVEIERNAGTQFHPGVAKAFVAVQRGEDPGRVLSAAELNEIRESAVAPGLPAIPGARDLRRRPELLVVGGASVALAGAGIGRLGLMLAGALVAAGGLALRASGSLRADRLANALESALSGERSDAFERVASCLEQACNAQWTALVSWQEHGLGGSIDLVRGEGGPAEAALMSWLVREGQARSELVTTAASDLGRSGVVVAVPLRRDNSALAGFLVALAPRSLPRHVELAVARSAPSLGPALAGRPDEPVRPDAYAAAVL